MGTRWMPFWLLLLLLLLLCLPAVCADPVDLSATLPVDPAVRIVELPNGLDVWIRKHGTPPGRLSIWLHVASGSLNEDEDQRGLAHFLEHMAFEGSENFPPGTLIRYFESIGLVFGYHQNAYTSYDETTYNLTLPGTGREVIEKGLLCMADFAFRLTLPEEEVEKERGVILEEFRARKGPWQRLWEELLPALLPGSRVAKRLPIGKENVVASATRSDLMAYYRKWYRPDNATLLIVGDAEPDMIQELVAEQFADWTPVEDPPPNADPGIAFYEGVHAAVFSDPELTQAEVGIVSVRPLRDLETVGDLRSELTDDIAAWIVNRRLQELIQKGQAPFQAAEVGASPLFNVCTYVDSSGEGAPEKWSEILQSVILEVKRAREHGFLARELHLARKATLAAVQQAARTESTQDAQLFLSAMNAAVSRGHKPISATQRLELVTPLLDTLTLAELQESVRTNFDPAARLSLVILPEREGLAVPSEQEVMAVAEQAENAQVEPPAAADIRQDLLDADPKPGAVMETTRAPDLGILSVTLTNGLRAHLRTMDFKKDQVFVNVTLAGGALRETTRDRGVTQAATLAFRQPAASHLSSTQIRDILTGRNITMAARSDTDAVQLRLVSSTADLREAFRLLHLMLTQPLVEQSALQRWKEETAQAIDRRAMDVEAQAGEELQALLTGGDIRARPLRHNEVSRLRLSAAQERVQDVVRHAPMELAVVGDVEEDTALQLVVQYLGSLRPRPRRDPRLRVFRRLHYGRGPLESEVCVETITPRAVVLMGWRGADWTDVKDRRVLQVAAEILTARLREQIRESRGLTYSIFCYAQAARTFPGTGLLTIVFTADPDKAPEAAAIARDVVLQFAQEGPTDTEMQTVRRQFRNLIEQSQQEPTYWAEVLADADYRGTRIPDVKQALGAYTSYTREDVMDALGRAVTEQRRLQVLALPGEVEDAAEGDDARADLVGASG
jgi:zinc protease